MADENIDDVAVHLGLHPQYCSPAYVKQRLLPVIGLRHAACKLMMEEDEEIDADDECEIADVEKPVEAERPASENVTRETNADEEVAEAEVGEAEVAHEKPTEPEDDSDDVDEMDCERIVNDESSASSFDESDAPLPAYDSKKTIGIKSLPDILSDAVPEAMRQASDKNMSFNVCLHEAVIRRAMQLPNVQKRQPVKRKRPFNITQQTRKKRRM
jgi:hypothetical protein